MKEGRKPDNPEKTPDDELQVLLNVPLSPRMLGTDVLRSCDPLSH